MTSPARALSGIVMSVRAMRYSMQAASVTITSTRWAQHVPSLSRASATTCCEVASLMRVLTRARPARGPSANCATSGCGLRSLKSAMDDDVIDRAHRAGDRHRDRHRIAVLHERCDIQFDLAVPHHGTTRVGFNRPCEARAWRRAREAVRTGCTARPSRVRADLRVRLQHRESNRLAC